MIEILFLSVLIVGVLTEILYKKIEKFKPIIISFSVALVLTLLCTHVLPELFSSHNHELGYYLLAGFIIQILLELLSKGIEHGHVHLHGEISNKELIVIFIGLAIHSFIEGMPINTIESSFHQHTITNIKSSFSTIYLSTILIHKLPIAAVLIIFLNTINSSYLKKFIFLFLFAVSSPLGGVFGELIINIDFFRGFSLNLLAISCGMLLHITTLLIFEDHHNSKRKIKNILTISAGIISGILIFSI
jgi:zinc transporter ZupT